MFESPVAATLIDLLVALAAGALIGIEREQSARRTGERGLGGARTFPLIALAGALAAMLTAALGAWPLVAALASLGALLAVTHHHRAQTGEGQGITTELAALVTFLLGVLTTLQPSPLEPPARYLLVLAIAGSTMAVLSVKEPLHAAVARLTPDDIYATAKFVILALVVLPLLPNRTYGPLDTLNPFNVGVMVVLIAGISFLGYFATRIIGTERALIVTGVLGGLASSTAVTVSLSQRVRETDEVVQPVTAGVIAASSVMFGRILMAVGFVEPSLLRSLALPMGAMMAVGLGLAGLIYWRSSGGPTTGRGVRLQNPFALSSALKFGLLYAIVLLAAKAASHYLGTRGLYLSAVVAGTTDVDAITLSAAKLHRDGLSASVAVTTITLAAFTNTFVKAGIAVWVGNKALGGRVLLAMTAVVAVGALMLLIV